MENNLILDWDIDEVSLTIILKEFPTIFIDQIEIPIKTLNKMLELNKEYYPDENSTS